MTHRVSDPVAMDLIADLLYQHSDWQDIIQGVADIVEATGRNTQDKE